MKIQDFVFFFVLIVACKNTPSSNKQSHDEAIVEKPDTSLIFIHGLNIDSRYWDAQVAFFSDNYNVLTMDLMNAESVNDTIRKWSIDGFADDIITLITSQNLNNLVLIGHSMSETIILKIHEKIPDKVIAIIGVDNFKDVAFDLASIDEKELNAFITTVENDYENQATDMVKGLFPKENVNREVYVRVLEDFKSADAHIVATIFRDLFPLWSQTKYMLAQLDFPLYLIMSDYSDFNEDGLKKYAKNGYKIFEIANSGHYPMVEQPDQFNTVLEDILQNHLSVVEN